MEEEYWVEGKWEYKASGKTMGTGDVDLSFSRGERMFVLQNLGNGWLKVRKEGNQYGFVPEGWVRKVDWLEAGWEYKSQGIEFSDGRKDISFPNLARMQTLELCPNGWILVRLDETYEEGLVPLSYLKQVDPNRVFKDLPSPPELSKPRTLSTPDVSQTVPSTSSSPQLPRSVSADPPKKLQQKFQNVQSGQSGGSIKVKEFTEIKELKEKKEKKDKKDKKQKKENGDKKEKKEKKDKKEKKEKKEKDKPTPKGRLVRTTSITATQPPPPIPSVPPTGTDKSRAPSIDTSSSWTISREEKSDYMQTFLKIAKSRGVIQEADRTVEEAIESFRKNYPLLPYEKVIKICDLADIKRDKKMDGEEFVVAHFLVNIASKGEKIPALLPEDFLASVSPYLLTLEKSYRAARLEQLERESKEESSHWEALEKESEVVIERRNTTAEKRLNLEEAMLKEEEELEKLLREQKELEERTAKLKQRKEEISRKKKATETLIANEMAELERLEREEKQASDNATQLSVRRDATLRRRKALDEEVKTEMQSERKAEQDYYSIKKKRQEMEERRKNLLLRKNVLTAMISEDKSPEGKKILNEKQESIIEKKALEKEKDLEAKRKALQQRRQLLHERRKQFDAQLAS